MKMKIPISRSVNISKRVYQWISDTVMHGHEYDTYGGWISLPQNIISDEYGNAKIRGGTDWSANTYTLNTNTNTNTYILNTNTKTHFKTNTNTCTLNMARSESARAGGRDSGLILAYLQA